MADIFQTGYQVLTSFPYNVIIIACVIAYILYYILTSFRGKEESQFQIEDFRESVYLATGKILDTFGITINAHLVRGIEPLGKVSKFYHHKGTIVPDFPDELKPKTKKADPKTTDLWLLQIGDKGLIHKIFGGHIDYLIIHNDHLSEYNPDKKQMAVKEDISFTPYGNVFITGKDGESFINDISFRRTLEEIQTHLQNYPRKVAYLELAQAKTLEKIKAEAMEKKYGYDMYKKSVLSSGKDLGEENEEN